MLARRPYVREISPVHASRMPEADAANKVHGRPVTVQRPTPLPAAKMSGVSRAGTAAGIRPIGAAPRVAGPPANS